MRRLACAGLAAVCCAPAPLIAGPSMIDFETLPDGSTPVDDQRLDHNQWYDAGGVRVRFGFDTDGDYVPDSDAVFEHIGKDGTDAFGNQFLNEVRDTAYPGYEARLGEFFLRSDRPLHYDSDFIVEYETPVTRLSGEIWDLDGATGYDEKWSVIGLDENGFVAAGCISGRWTRADEYSFDGRPWRFALETDRPVKRLWVRFLGSKTSDVGFAFNNFDATGAGVAVRLLGVAPGDADGVVRGVHGVTELTLLWSLPVSISEYDVAVTDSFGTPVQVSVDASDPQRTRLELERAIFAETFTVRVADTAVAAVTGAAIDGDGDGVPGGDAVRTLTHVCPADVNEDGVVNIADLTLFIRLSQDRCGTPGQPDTGSGGGTGDNGGTDEGDPGDGDEGPGGDAGGDGGTGDGGDAGDDGGPSKPLRPIAKPVHTVGGSLGNQPRRR